MTQSHIPPFRGPVIDTREKRPTPQQPSRAMLHHVFQPAAVGLIFLAFIFAGAGCIVLFLQVEASESLMRHTMGFQTDNAIAAIALEHIAKHPPRSAGPWFIASLLCLLILSVERVRAAVLATRE